MVSFSKCITPHYERYLGKIHNTRQASALTSHRLAKLHSHSKEKNKEIILISEVFDNTVLFNSLGIPYQVSLPIPVALTKFNGQRVKNLDILIKEMANLPINSTFEVEGIQAAFYPQHGMIKYSSTVKGYGVKCSVEKSKQFLENRKVQRSHSSNIDSVVNEHKIFSSEGQLAKEPKPLYHSKTAPEPIVNSLKTNDAQRINLDILILCQHTNLVILKPKEPELLEPFHEQAVSLPENFLVNNNEKVRVYQKNISTQKDIIKKVKANNFSFDHFFSFSLSQYMYSRGDLSAKAIITSTV